MPLPVVLVVVDGGVEFRSLPNRLGRIGAIRVAETDWTTLADYFTQAFGLPRTGTLDRLLAALAVLAERGEIRISTSAMMGRSPNTLASHDSVWPS